MNWKHTNKTNIEVIQEMANRDIGKVIFLGVEELAYIVWVLPPPCRFLDSRARILGTNTPDSPTADWNSGKGLQSSQAWGTHNNKSCQDVSHTAPTDAVGVEHSQQCKTQRLVGWQLRASRPMNKGFYWILYICIHFSVCRNILLITVLSNFSQKRGNIYTEHIFEIDASHKAINNSQYTRWPYFLLNPLFCVPSRGCPPYAKMC